MSNGYQPQQSKPSSPPHSQQKALTGQKHDEGKPRWELLPWNGMEEVVQVLTYGAEKYAPDNWRQVPNYQSRYTAAALRHISAYMRGEEQDQETGRHHLAHATCCLLFLLELDCNPAQPVPPRHE
ncbi:dATP/dGTP diphosphohydrolase domain-containing protein [Microbulbifer sp. 2201CG32-9]|uniref:dATP/dGTP diphosphohydrolase domain-containing protein n=1 Tax=Microbulbifer sp. 2201CG32-9 TaxID=3232309 RepID=UPI00345B83EC